MPKTTERNSKTALADKEYNRLTKIYKNANVDAVKLEINDALIRKVAELWADLELLKALPALVYDKKDPSCQRETPAGKMRVKYMAQYVNAMQKLNKELLGKVNNDSDELDDYE